MGEISSGAKLNVLVDLAGLGIDFHEVVLGVLLAGFGIILVDFGRLQLIPAFFSFVIEGRGEQGDEA